MIIENRQEFRFANGPSSLFLFCLFLLNDFSKFVSMKEISLEILQQFRVPSKRKDVLNEKNQQFWLTYRHMVSKLTT